MAWWSPKKKAAIEETRNLAEKIDAIQSLKDISTLTSALHEVLLTIDERLNELEKKFEEQVNG